ncbi:B-box zinc finger protein 20-like isoform X2 [Typha latifolia]|uniref:B-box zinc finger protein 20-like isoform X2 n=1 Tax=Typha latifolia TaxID=4733 RepID=UPI003C30A273
MKVLCDVCGGEEAAVFCCADEAALCAGCDGRVHHANKLAGKHRRFSLSSATSVESNPLCDVCKERRGFVFCQEDRAILCRDCDDPIHSANHLTMKHNRFLLAGAKLSSSPIFSSSSPESKYTLPKAKEVANDTKKDSGGGGGVKAKQVKNFSSESSVSSISEYLTKVCPGWHVEDFLVDDAAAVAAVGGFSKESQMLPFLEADLDGGGLDSAASDFSTWVPHVPQVQRASATSSSGGGAAGAQFWVVPKEVNPSFGRERWNDDAFMVPEIPKVSNPSKRARSHLWYY